jgi:hypothetical protein
VTPAGELAALGAHYGIAVDDLIADHGRALDRYAEWVLGRDAFALVTLGDAPALAGLVGGTSGDRLRAAAACWSGAVTGVKLELGARVEPTLYVRVLCPWDDAISWLAGAGLAAAVRVPPARTMYGLGFQGELVKTYALAPGGFVSYRLAGGELLREPKAYRADVAWSAIAWPDPRWAAIGELGRALGFETAGHVGLVGDTRKIYVERSGAIATDRSFA